MLAPEQSTLPLPPLFNEEKEAKEISYYHAYLLTEKNHIIHE
jgi:hypothetical protein